MKLLTPPTIITTHTLKDTDEVLDDSHIPEIPKHILQQGRGILTQNAERQVVVDRLKQLAQNGGLSVVVQSLAAVDEAEQDVGWPHLLRNRVVEVAGRESSCLHVTLQSSTILAQS